MCMNSRAVHLELARSLKTDDCMLVLMRFLNCRGHGVDIRCDNGANFVGENKEIRKHVKTMKHSKPAHVWERLVRTVRIRLKAVRGNRDLAMIADDTVIRN